MIEASALRQHEPARDEFAALLDEQFGRSSRLEGTVLRGTVVAIVVETGPHTRGKAFLTCRDKPFTLLS